MSNLRMHDLDDTRELAADTMCEIRGGIWDYSNRLGYVGQAIEDSRNPPSIGGNGPTIEGAATTDDSAYYGLRPIRS